jgi:hypothetical protein
MAISLSPRWQAAGAELKALKDPAFLTRVTMLPGYDAHGIGAALSVREVLRAA